MWSRRQANLVPTAGHIFQERSRVRIESQLGESNFKREYQPYSSVRSVSDPNLNSGRRTTNQRTTDFGFLDLCFYMCGTDQHPLIAFTAVAARLGMDWERTFGRLRLAKLSLHSAMYSTLRADALAAESRFGSMAPRPAKPAGCQSNSATVTARQAQLPSMRSPFSPASDIGKQSYADCRTGSIHWQCSLWQNLSHRVG